MTESESVVLPLDDRATIVSGVPLGRPQIGGGRQAVKCFVAAFARLREGVPEALASTAREQPAKAFALPVEPVGADHGNGGAPILELGRSHDPAQHVFLGDAAA